MTIIILQESDIKIWITLTWTCHMHAHRQTQDGTERFCTCLKKTTEDGRFQTGTSMWLSVFNHIWVSSAYETLGMTSVDVARVHTVPPSSLAS